MSYNSGSNHTSNFNMGQVEIMSMITPWIVGPEIQLLINCLYNKLQN